MTERYGAKEWVEIVRSVTTTVAVAVAGLWAYSQFDLNRER